MSEFPPSSAFYQEVIPYAPPLTRDVRHVHRDSGRSASVHVSVLEDWVDRLRVFAEDLYVTGATQFTDSVAEGVDQLADEVHSHFCG